MRRALAVGLLLGCAHAPVPEAETETAPIEGKSTLQLSDDTTPPVRKSCRSRGPRLAASDRLSGSIIVDFQVGADGKVSGVSVEGDASDGAVRALRRYLESCRYAPATRGGKPVAVPWKGELNFPKR